MNKELTSGSHFFTHQLKQIGVRAGTMECNGTSRRVNFIDEYPIALDMAAKRAFPFTMKRVVTTFWRQRLFIDDNIHDFNEFIKFHATLFHQLVLFSERLWINRFKHRLIVGVVPFKVFNHLCKGMKTLGWDFPPHHRPAFPYSGGGFVVKAFFPGYRIAVCGADRTFTFKVKTVIGVGCRGESKNNRSRCYFARHVNCQSATGRYVYGFRNSHKENIA